MYGSIQESRKRRIEEFTEWNVNLHSFVADQILENANEWAENDEENTEVIDKQQFMDRIKMNELVIYPDGYFTVYYFDDDMFWGHSIEVSANISGKMMEANIVG